MTTKLCDLSQLFWDGASMWPRFASEIQVRARTFGGVRSTGWHGLNHPGWYDMGQPFPFNQSVPGASAGGWVGHLHAGTHVDAPIYCIPEGITADKIPLEFLAHPFAPYRSGIKLYEQRFCFYTRWFHVHLSFPVRHCGS